MSTKYRYEFTSDAFKQNFRNLLEDLEALSASIVSSLAQAVLLAGRSGGQQVAGGTAASEDLTLTSNATATKDRIFLGSAQASAYDEANVRLGIGQPAPSAKIVAEDGVDAETRIGVKNTNASGTGALARVRASANDTSLLDIQAHGAGRTNTRYGVTLGAWLEIITTGGNGLLLGTGATATPVVIGTNSVERMRIDSNGNVEIGTAALATNATNGFLYITTCAGTPTGTPTAKTGRVPLIYDTTNNKLYVYNGAWKSVTLA